MSGRLLTLAKSIKDSRPPDLIIGGAENPYMLRWYVIPHNSLFNIYAHTILRSDDDRYLHDHRACNVSLVLSPYLEHFILDGGIHQKVLRKAGDVVFRSGSRAHRIELLKDAEGKEIPAHSIFIKFPDYRQWGFHCGPLGWLHHDDYEARFGQPLDLPGTALQPALLESLRESKA